jgi:hypothetical protein
MIRYGHPSRDRERAVPLENPHLRAWGYMGGTARLRSRLGSSFGALLEEPLSHGRGSVVGAGHP